MVRETRALGLLAALLAGVLGACAEDETIPTAPFRVAFVLRGSKPHDGR